jgi:hypothetical protein
MPKKKSTRKKRVSRKIRTKSRRKSTRKKRSKFRKRRSLKKKNKETSMFNKHGHISWKIALKDAKYQEKHEKVKLFNINNANIKKVGNNIYVMFDVIKSKKSIQYMFNKNIDEIKKGNSYKIQSNQHCLKELKNKKFDPSFCWTFITLFPQIKLQKNKRIKTKQRLKKLLGLSLKWDYDYAIRGWVNINDIFRPCSNSNINDNKCNLKNKKEDTMIDLYKNIRKKSFPNSAPFTGLGYTYDWGTKSGNVVGLSEYIIKPGSKVKIVDIFTIDDYLTNINN